MCLKPRQQNLLICVGVLLAWFWFWFWLFFPLALHLGNVKNSEKTLSTLLVLYFGGNNWKTSDSKLLSHTSGWKAIRRLVPFLRDWSGWREERQQGKMEKEKITDILKKRRKSKDSIQRRSEVEKLEGKVRRCRVKGNGCLKSNGSIWSPGTGTPNPHRVLISFNTLGQK